MIMQVGEYGRYRSSRESRRARPKAAQRQVSLGCIQSFRLLPDFAGSREETLQLSGKRKNDIEIHSDL